MLSVDLLTRHHNDEINGLSRYDRALFEGLRNNKDLTVALRPLQPSSNMLFEQVRKLSGLDIMAFLQTYPLRLPPVDGDLRHITTSGHAIGLWQMSRKPTVITVHDIIHYTHRHDRRLSTYHHIVDRFADMLAIRHLRYASAIIASSAFTRQQLIHCAGLHPDQIHVVPLGVNTDRFHPRDVPPAFYERYGLNARTPYVLHISSEEPRKNVETLLRAWRIVRDQHSDAVLLKVGRCLHPAERPRLLKLIAELGIGDSVRFIDVAPDQDLPLFYNAARAFAFPSLAEGFGFPVLEAMACGVPITCSDAPALTELVAGVARQHPAMDIAALAEQLERMLSNPTERAHAFSCGIARAAQFSWERTAEQTYHIYMGLG